MAEQLIDSLTTDFDPSAYRDEYREELLALIERKAEGKEIVAPEAEAPQGDQGARPDGGARGEHRRGQGQSGARPAEASRAAKKRKAQSGEKQAPRRRNAPRSKAKAVEVARGHEPPGRGRRA